MRKDAAIGIVLDDDKQKILLVKRCDVPIWVLPGGGIEKGEKPEEAVCREVWEETGFRVKVSRQLGTYTPINRLAKPTYLFECKIIDGMARTGCETSAIAFFELNQFPHTFFQVHRDWLKDAFDPSEPLPFNKITDNVTYFAFLKYALRHPYQVLKFLLS